MGGPGLGSGGAGCVVRLEWCQERNRGGLGKNMYFRKFESLECMLRLTSYNRIPDDG
jgi:hypothetical protein